MQKRTEVEAFIDVVYVKVRDVKIKDNKGGVPHSATPFLLVWMQHW